MVLAVLCDLECNSMGGTHGIAQVLLQASLQAALLPISMCMHASDGHRSRCSSKGSNVLLMEARARASATLWDNQIAAADAMTMHVLHPQLQQDLFGMLAHWLSRTCCALHALLQAYMLNWPLKQGNWPTRSAMLSVFFLPLLKALLGNDNVVLRLMNRDHVRQWRLGARPALCIMRLHDLDLHAPYKCLACCSGRMEPLKRRVSSGMASIHLRVTVLDELEESIGTTS